MVLLYFPLIPRLFRMHKSSKRVKDMLGHHKDRVKEGRLRHPAYVEAWKDFDEKKSSFCF